MPSDGYLYISTHEPTSNVSNRTIYRIIIGGYKGFRSEIRKCIGTEMCENVDASADVSFYSIFSRLFKT